MDSIFKALNDAVRREILDCLREDDGQSLADLEARFEMTRFGVMKHLRVLEDANLITTRKVGRFKYHYLNALCYHLRMLQGESDQKPLAEKGYQYALSLDPNEIRIFCIIIEVNQM